MGYIVHEVAESDVTKQLSTAWDALPFAFLCGWLCVCVCVAPQNCLQDLSFLTRD